LNSNEVPLDSESALLASAIAKTGPRVTFLEKEILRLQDRLKRLEEEHAALSAYRAQNTAILSPLRQIPPKLLFEIFSRTLPSVSEAKGDGPWLLTHISSYWQAVALSNPSLW
ncbi:hypothetical protein B0H17DRAFT_866370, partial [Mycena rosella]